MARTFLASDSPTTREEETHTTSQRESEIELAFMRVALKM